jgi:hypothetical protein
MIATFEQIKAKTDELRTAEKDYATSKAATAVLKKRMNEIRKERERLIDFGPDPQSQLPLVEEPAAGGELGHAPASLDEREAPLLRRAPRAMPARPTAVCPPTSAACSVVPCRGASGRLWSSNWTRRLTSRS